MIITITKDDFEDTPLDLIPKSTEDETQAFWDWVNGNAIRIGRHAVITSGEYAGREVALRYGIPPLIDVLDAVSGEHLGKCRPEELRLLPITESRIPFSVDDIDGLRSLEGRVIAETWASIDAYLMRYSLRKGLMTTTIKRFLRTENGLAFFEVDIPENPIQGIAPETLYACFDFYKPVDGNPLIGKPNPQRKAS